MSAMAGCVSSGRYEQAVQDATQAKTEQQRATHALTAQLESERRQAAELQEQIKGLQATTAARDKELAEARARDKELGETKAKLGETWRFAAIAQARAAQFKDIATRLKQMVDAGNLQVTLRDGRMVLALPNDVAFDTGRTAIKPAGREALTQIARVLKGVPHRHFLVTGHTDDVPIHNAAFASNWELSSARALRVVHYLIDEGVDPAALSAAGYGEFDPVSPNDAPDGRKRNRRTEIALQPNVDEIVNLPNE